MDDLTITRLCAEAMGDLPAMIEHEGKMRFGYRGCMGPAYDPLHDDAQCMTLAKSNPALFAVVVRDWAHERIMNRNADLNRMLCEEFAKEEAKK